MQWKTFDKSIDFYKIFTGHGIRPIHNMEDILIPWIFPIVIVAIVATVV